MSVPVIVGVGDVIQRDVDRQCALGPIELMVEAARRAGTDGGAPGLLGRVDWLAVVGGKWRYRNPAEVIARQIGANHAATALTGTTGNAPQEIIGIAAERIAKGMLDVALVVGGEARYSERQLQRAQLAMPWGSEDGASEPEHLVPLFHNVETGPDQLGSIVPLYALMEDSLRAAGGRTVAEHRADIAALWARFSAVAVSNPTAWDRREWTAPEIGTATAENRMIAFPYTKALVANNYVDMASAVLITSLDVALAAGVPRDRLVFIHAITASADTSRLVHRHALHEVPALAAAGQRAFEVSGISAADVTHIDLYSCFPAIVQMSAKALRLPLDRPLTVTGGLRFAGAPLANAAGQALTKLVPKVRADGWGVVHANGGAATKHAFGVYAAHPSGAFQFERVDDVDHRSREEIPAGWAGRVQVEAATVLYDRGGGARVVASVRAGDRRRFAVTTHAEAVELTETIGIAGREGTLAEDGSLVVN